MTYQKKALIIHHSGAIGGAGVSLLHILEAIKKLNLDVTVYCPIEPNDMAIEIRKLGYKVVSEPSNIPIIQHYSGGSKFFFDYRTLRNIASIIKSKKSIKELIIKTRPDIVMVNSMTLSYIGKIAQSMNIESICFHRETYAKGFFGIRTKVIKFQLSNHFKKVVFISQYDLKQSGEMKSRTFVVTDKVKLNEYEENQIDASLVRTVDDNTIKLLYVGGMNRLKGAHILIKALAKCEDNIHLIFLQYGGNKRKKQFSDCGTLRAKIRYLIKKDYTARVLSLIDKNQMWHRVHFIPTTTIMAPIIKKCDIVVFPSTLPHQARPIYESGAAKKPIIITESPNISEFVEDGINGLTFKNGDYIALASAINKLADNNLLKEKLGEKNYLRTINHHDYKTLENQLREIINI